MDDSRSTQILLLLGPEDEEELFARVREKYPEVVLLEVRGWRAVDDPLIRYSPTECGPIAAIWNRALCSTVRGHVRSNGVISGPQVGLGLVQWLRSTHPPFMRNLNLGHVLMAGRWAASYHPLGEPEMAKFVAGIWRIVKKFTTNRLVVGGEIGREVELGRSVRDVWAGPAALDAARAGNIELAEGRSRLLPE